MDYDSYLLTCSQGNFLDDIDKFIDIAEEREQGTLKYAEKTVDMR